MNAFDRRELMRFGVALAAGVSLNAQASRASAAEAEIDTGIVRGDGVEFPTWVAPTERPSGGPPKLWPTGRRVGFAVMGLGRLSLEEILPAFGQAEHARLVGLISGTPAKAKLIASHYGVPDQAVYGYDDWERIKADPAIEAVYVVLPNSLHKDATVRAAEAGKHVLCEKPMASSVADCEAMVEACETAGRKLMIAYRSQYEPHNRALQTLVRESTYGAPGLMDAANVQNMAAPTQWRLRKTMAGGGALPDIGLYCLNAARFLTGEEPVELIGRVHSTPGDERFREVEETVSFMLRFPSGLIANCAASYGLHEARRLGLHMPGASVEFQNAFAYEGHRLIVSRRDGKAEAVAERRLPVKNQFALELDHMADCVRTGRMPRTPGQEGLQDQRLMEAIYRSAATNQPVTIEPKSGIDTTRGPALVED